MPSLLALVLASSGAVAGEPWLAPGNMQARHDLQMLVDDGVLDLPVSGWPIAVSDIAAALSRVPATRPSPRPSPAAAGEGGGIPSPATAGEGGRRPGEGTRLTPAQFAAVARLRKLASEGRPELGVEVRAAARPTQLRTFADEPREEGELTGWASGFLGDRWGGRLELTVVADADDDDTFRYDGSYFAGKFGNWIVTAGAQDRWWGSGWEGSLILTNSARPVPAISLDRAVSDPFESKWLRWIGPWRLTTFMGYMEGDREDFDHPLLFGFRVSARPLEGLEISLERTAQWCGEGRSCDGSDFWNLWWGNDNAGENVDPEDEPGNQLAGWDIRWASPIGDWNYAIYNQHTGETIDNKIPRPYRSMDIAGLETWGGSADGSSWRAGLEWANTRCGGTVDEKRIWDCAYNNGIFNVEGYRSKGRPLGHSMDGDGEMYSARYIRVSPSAATLTTVLRFTAVNEGGGVPDTRHTVAPGPEDWWSLDVTYRHPIRGGWVEASVGADYRDREWNDTEAVLPRASVSWRYQVQ
jgi:hypothetical protein